MKTKTAALLSLFFLSFHLIEAQEPWDLFQYNQRTYYVQDGNLKLHYNDSIEVLTSKRKHYLGAKYYGQTLENCFDTIYNNPDLLDLINIDEIPPIEAWYSEDGIFSIPLQTDTIKINVLAQEGESWIQPTTGNPDVDYFQISCNSIVWDNVLGFEDSIKVLSFQAFMDDTPIDHPVNELNWKISKQLGLVKYFPPDNFFFTPTNSSMLNMVGFLKYGELYGYYPSLNLFTQNYAVGNIYKWEFYKYSPTFSHTRKGEYRDSVFAIVDKGESFKVYVSRKGYEINSGLYYPVSETTYFSDTVTYYFHLDLEQYFNIPPGWFEVLNDGLIRELIVYPLNDGYRIIYSGNYGSLYFDFDNCEIELNGLFNSTVTGYTPSLGFDYYHSGSYYGSENTHEIIGAIIGNDTIGNYWPVSIHSPTSQSSQAIIKLSPNPAHLFLDLTLLDQNLANTELNYSIFNSNGQLMLTESRTGLNQQFNIGYFPKGLYILTIQTPTGTQTLKWIKS